MEHEYPGWIGYAIAGLIVILGNAIFNWWNKIKKSHQDDVDFIVGKYKECLQQEKADVFDLKTQMDALTKEHINCSATLAEYRLRLDSTEQTIRELREEITKLKAPVPTTTTTTVVKEVVPK